MLHAPLHAHLGLRRLLVALVALAAMLVPSAPATAEPFEHFEQTYTDVRAPLFSDLCDLEVSFTEHVEGRSKIIKTDPITELNLQESEVTFTADGTDGQAVLFQRGVTRLAVTELHGDPDAGGVVEATGVGRTVFHNRWASSDGTTLLVESGIRTFSQRFLVDVDDPSLVGVPDDPMFRVLDVQGRGLASDTERAAAICPQLR